LIIDFIVLTRRVTMEHFYKLRLRASACHITICNQWPLGAFDHHQNGINGVCFFCNILYLPDSMAIIQFAKDNFPKKNEQEKPQGH